MSSLINFIWSNSDRERGRSNNSGGRQVDHAAERLQQSVRDGTQLRDIAFSPPVARRLPFTNEHGVLNESAIQPSIFSPVSLSTFEDDAVDLNDPIPSSGHQPIALDTPLTFDYLNDPSPIRSSDWKTSPHPDIIVETNSSEKDVNESLGGEIAMIQKSIQKKFNLSPGQEPRVEQLFDVYLGAESPITTCIMTACGLDYHSFLKFMNTICILIVFKMSYKSLQNVQELLQPELMVSELRKCTYMMHTFLFLY